ncbi:MAG TPA: sulfite exporter TauE/SafE family protein [Terriglobia bacterium]|nr:sulfite exporter TauE/SafE family protein [Terriglobia bacterium]
MTFPDAILLFLAAVVAGALNSVAGGGSFFSFPALLFTGVPAIPANATSTVAVWPGSVASAFAYRRRVPHSARVMAPLTVASFAGGLLGAGLLLHTRQSTFMRLIPFLFFAATLLFALGKRISRAIGSHGRQQLRPSWLAIGGVSLIQFAIATYGGYFGGGMGILMLAFLTLLPLGDVHATNGVKALLAAATNGVAIVAFVVARMVLWPQAVLMLTGSILGGYGGAHYAQKVNPARVRGFVVVTGLAMSAYFLWKYH